MAGKGAKFKRVFGKVSGQGVTDAKADALTAIADLVKAIEAAKAAPPEALETANEMALKLRASVNVLPKEVTTDKDKFDHYVAAEMKARKQIKSAEALQASAGKVGKLKDVMKNDGGAKTLDKLVEKIGTAKSTEEKATVIAAIQARYDINVVSGELSTKALPKLYKVLGMVPESHARFNDSLKVLERTKANDTSDFASDKQKVRINAGESGFDRLDDDEYTSGEDNTTGKKVKPVKLERFTAVTLHEIGHAVDDKETYMDKHQAAADHGGWLASSEDEVLGLAMKEKGFAARHPDMLPNIRKKILDEVLASGNVKSSVVSGNASVLTAAEPDDLLKDKALVDLDTEFTQFLKDNADADAKAVADFFFKAKNTHMKKSTSKGNGRMLVNNVMRIMQDDVCDLKAAVKSIEAQREMVEHYPSGDTEIAAIENDEAIKWLQSVRLSQGKGLWSNGTSEASKAAIGGTVYQEAYKGKWWSYSLAARSTQVSNYQFRAPGEWYAEAYAVFFMGKLAKSHPLHAVLQKAVDDNKKKAA